MMNELIFATHNANKAKEVKVLLPHLKVQSLSEIGFYDEIPETGETLQDNALIKARTIFKTTGKPCFADDTGLEVEALNGAPGVYSARYAGEGANSENNMDKLLTELDGKENRKAQFRTVIAYIDNTGKEHLFEGSVQGEILKARQGGEGFGYDPIFLPEGETESFAEMSAVRKNTMSHRGRAMRKLTQYLTGVEK
ncbi:non-canonical purine NTP pyrophosphatase, rdgB/HAM1 family [Owenweeksia hongkongensis DSM 17368]|uniref:dITP/XTP pyrophosphatase n=1 Tax=Owenweeksia hongkongensis (strain DSM 17368 / CIP 108786 / JCM 12287 / NRRL B-23963 / UST20020801) TaxID=926562 RepID=G8R7M5_OWEHD|nr:RdgB/HAM1 family non-canonical purine NTP pyrophosphatase [Owenweeksia hongkongensis]AEV32378.1 non-canonical purine NTP pyrophosphatase, rdgB/HAM1 family [Owenweeksia hongkongensis DSM 17368]